MDHGRAKGLARGGLKPGEGQKKGKGRACGNNLLVLS